MGQSVKTTYPLQDRGNCHFVHTTYFEPLVFFRFATNAPQQPPFSPFPLLEVFLSNANNCCLATKYSPWRNPVDYYFFPSFTFLRERERERKKKRYLCDFKFTNPSGAQAVVRFSNEMHNPLSRLQRETGTETPRVFQGRCMNSNRFNNYGNQPNVLGVNSTLQMIFCASELKKRMWTCRMVFKDFWDGQARMHPDMFLLIFSNPALVFYRSSLEKVISKWELYVSVQALKQWIYSIVPLKTERVPVASRQCGLNSGLSVICLFIQDNKSLLW